MYFLVGFEGVNKMTQYIKQAMSPKCSKIFHLTETVGSVL